MSFWTLWHVAYIEDFQQMRELLILITLAKLRQMGSLVQLFKTLASVSLNLIMESLYMEPEVELENTACSCFKNSAICVSLILSQYNLLTDAYHIIGLAYKFLLTISITQIACERSFSTLKFKNRLRSSMSQEHLEGFMLMGTEKEILVSRQ